MFTADQLAQARTTLASMIMKLEKTLAGLSETAKPQRTLALRRIEALRIAQELIEREVPRT